LKTIRIALTKGRLEEDSVELFKRAALDCSALEDKKRKLLFPIEGGKYEVVLAKALDVITYVEHGVCDVGITGKDIIMEYGSSFYEVLDLNFGCCRFAVAGPSDLKLFDGWQQKKIATKYPKAASEYFRSKGVDVEIIRIDGSGELAPILKLSDAIFDIVQTGNTLKENGLVILEEVCPISARMIVNNAAMKMKKAEIEELINKLSGALEA